MSAHSIVDRNGFISSDNLQVNDYVTATRSLPVINDYDILEELQVGIK